MYHVTTESQAIYLLKKFVREKRISNLYHLSFKTGSFAGITKLLYMSLYRMTGSGNNYNSNHLLATGNMPGS